MGGGADSLLDKEEYMALIEAALENFPDGVLVVDQRWRMVYFNNRFLEMWGIPSWVHTVRDDRQSIQTVLDKLEDPDGFLEKVEFLQAHQDLCSKDELRLKDGRVFDRYTTPLHDGTGRFLGRIWFFRDITDKIKAQRRRLEREAEIQRLEKLDTLRTFAASVTHHLNNLLFGILGNLELAERALDGDGPEVAEYLHNAKEVTSRAADFAEQMFFFIGHHIPTYQDIEISSLIQQVIKRVAKQAPEGVDIRLLSRDEMVVQGDPALLSAALEAVCNNAVEASCSRGEIRISWRRSDPPAILHRSRVMAETKGHLQEGEFVLIEVEDDGCGMDKEVQEKAFDPFFTTKEFGRGLGLAQVLGIVQAHGGEVDMVSKPGKGTRISLFLPLK